MNHSYKIVYTKISNLFFNAFKDMALHIYNKIYIIC